MAFIASGLLPSTTVEATDMTWDNSATAGIQGGAGTWSTAVTNWTPDDGTTRTLWDNVGSADDTALFTVGWGTVSLAETINLAELKLTSIGSATLNSITVTGYRFNGGTLNFGAQSGKIDTTATGLLNHQINSNLTGTSGLTIASTGVDAGQGRLVLNGDNTGLSGGIIITSGLVAFTSQSAAGSNLITLNGGGIFGAVNHVGTGSSAVTGPTTQSLSNAIALAASSTSSLRVWGGRTLTLTGSVSGSGALTKTDGGTAVLENFSGTGAITVSSGVLRFTQSSLTLSQVINPGDGTLNLAGSSASSTNSINGTVSVTGGGTLSLRGSGSGSISADASSTILTTGNQGSGYGQTYNIAGNGVAATTGLKLGSGITSRGTINVTTAATTIRASGATAATFIGFDYNGTHISTSAAASGTVIDSLVNLNAGSYGLVTNVAAGANHSTGDLVIHGSLAGALNGNNNRFWFNKGGQTGSILLNGTGSTSSFTQIDAGKLFIGNNSALGTGTLVIGGNATLASYNGDKAFSNKVFIANNRTATIDTALGDLSLSGVISGALNYATAAGTGNNLTKTGTGTLTLSGTNTYSGSTNVNGGTLVINGNHSAATGTVTVADNATLGGSGTLGGSVVFQDGATHAPGTSPGLPTLGSADYQSGSIFQWELVSNTTAGRGTAYDGVNVTNSLTVGSGALFDIILNGSGSTVNFSDPFWTESRSWNVFTAGSVAGLFTLGTVSTDAFGNSYSSYGNFTFTGSGGNLSLEWSAVPEPSSALGGLLIAAALFRRRR